MSIVMTGTSSSRGWSTLPNVITPPKEGDIAVCITELSCIIMGLWRAAVEPALPIDQMKT